MFFFVFLEQYRILGRKGIIFHSQSQEIYFGTFKQNVFWMAFIKVQLSWQTENSPRVDQAKVKKLSLYKLNHNLLSLTTLGQRLGFSRKMSNTIYPRSPYEKMDGWVHLPRLIDKIRLNKAGQLHEDYQPNYLNKGFDLAWFEASGVASETLIEVVTN